MESNMEARTNKTDTNLHGSSGRYSLYPNGGSFTLRQNGSLPRKFTTNSNIPVRTDYYNNYSHGKSNFLCTIEMQIHGKTTS